MTCWPANSGYRAPADKELLRIHSAAQDIRMGRRSEKHGGAGVERYLDKLPAAQSFFRRSMAMKTRFEGFRQPPPLHLRGGSLQQQNEAFEVPPASCALLV